MSQSGDLTVDSADDLGAITDVVAAIAENAQGAPLYVMVKNDGRWRLAACQNTPVVTA